MRSVKLGTNVHLAHVQLIIGQLTYCSIGLIVHIVDVQFVHFQVVFWAKVTVPIDLLFS